MSASMAIESARGADFLLSINRLNVAISRAQALAVVVHSETLLQGNPSNINDIKRFNFFQQLISYHLSSRCLRISLALRYQIWDQVIFRVLGLLFFLA